MCYPWSMCNTVLMANFRYALWCCFLLGVIEGSNKVPTLADLMAADVFELSGWEEDEETDETAAEETGSKVSKVCSPILSDSLLHLAVHLV